jgi:molybdopterin converting factor small subunit
MNQTVHIPTPLRSLTSEQASVSLDAETVGDALQQLADRYPKIRQHLFDDGGRLRSFVSVYVGDEDIRFLEREQTRLEPGAEVSIVPSIAGG